MSLSNYLKTVAMFSLANTVKAQFTNNTLSVTQANSNSPGVALFAGIAIGATCALALVSIYCKSRYNKKHHDRVASLERTVSGVSEASTDSGQGSIPSYSITATQEAETPYKGESVTVMDADPHCELPTPRLMISSPSDERLTLDDSAANMLFQRRLLKEMREFKRSFTA